MIIHWPNEIINNKSGPIRIETGGCRWRPTDAWRGRAEARDWGGSQCLVFYCRRLHDNRVQGIFCCLTSIHISKYDSSKNLAKWIFCNVYLFLYQYCPLYLWHEDTQGWKFYFTKTHNKTRQVNNAAKRATSNKMVVLVVPSPYSCGQTTTFCWGGIFFA